MDTQGTIGIKATLDISEMQRNVQKYVQNINMMQDHTDVASQSVARSFSRMQAAGAAFLSIDMAKRLASEMISVYGTFQQLDISFRTMLRNGEKARALMGELVDFAAITPYNLTDVGQGAKQLLAYGTAANKITTELEMLGNVASGVSAPLNDLIYLYGTLRSQGRAYTVDIRQFAGRGIPIYEELAKVLNVSVGEVNALVEAGRVGFPEVEKAFQNMTSKGGMFFNLMKDQSKSVTGQISNLQDKIQMKFNELGKSNDKFITGALEGANYLVDHYEEISSALAVLVSLYGIHKTALIAQAAAYKAFGAAENAAILNAEAEALQSLETEEIKAKLTKQGLKAGSEEYVRALDVEIKAEKERLEQIATNTNEELSLAKDRLKLAEQIKEKAQQNVQSKKEELASILSDAQATKTASLEKKMSLEREKQSRAALRVVKLQEEKDAAIAEARHLKEIGASKEKITAKNKEIATIDKKILAAKSEEIQRSRNVVSIRKEIAAVEGSTTTKRIEKLQTQLNTAEQKLNSASLNVNTAAREVNQLKTKAGIATKNADTLTTQLNTIEEKKNTAAKSLSARATGLLGKSWSKLMGVMKANKWTLILAAIAAVGYGLYKLITADTQAEKAQKDLNKQLDEASKKKQELQSATDQLISRINSETETIYSQVRAYQELLKLFPELGNMSFEQFKSMPQTEQKRMFSFIYDKREIDNAFKAYEDDLKKIKLVNKQIQDVISAGVKTPADAQYLSSLTGRLEYLNKTAEGHKAIIEKIKEAQWEANTPVEEKIKYYENLQSQLTRERDELSKTLLASENVEGVWKGMPNIIDQIKLDVLNKRIEETGEKIKSYIITPDKNQSKNYSFWEKQKKDAEDALKVLDITEKGSDKWNKLLNKIAEADKNISVYSSSKSNKSIEEANKLKVETDERLRQLNEQMQREREATVQAEMDISQAKIDAMNEGYLKQQAQIELNFRKAKVENDRRTNEYIKSQQEIERLAFEKEHPDYKKKGLVFEPKTKTKADLSRDKQDTLAAYESAAADARKKAEVALFKSLTDEYQSYTDQRIAIEKKFNDDLSALQAVRSKYLKNGDTDKVAQIDRSIAQATKDKGKSLMGLDFEQLKQTPEYVRAFENLKNTSSETLNSLLSQLEDAKQTAARVLNPEDLREYTSTIQSIMDELESRNPFKALLDRKKELDEVGEELARAKEQLDYVQAGGKIVTGIKGTKFNKETGFIEVENEYLSVAKAIEIYNKAKEKAVSTDNNYRKAEKAVAEQIEELGSVLESVGDSIGGTSGEIISCMGSIASFTSTSIDGISTLASVAAKDMHTVEKASVILNIISVGIQLLQKLNSLLPDAYAQYEAYSEKIKEINRLKDTVNEYTVAVMEARQAEEDWFSDKNLNSLRNYQRLHKEITDAYYGKLYENQATYQNQKGGGWLTGGLNGIMNTLSPLGWTGVWQKWTGQNYKEGMSRAIDNLRIETRKKSKGFLGTGIGAKSQKTEDLATWIKNKPEFKGADLFEDKGLIDKELAKQVVEKYGDKLVGETKDTLEALIELREKYDEYMEQLHDYVSSLYEPLVGNFVDSLWDWLDSGKDALKSFKEYAAGTFRDIVTDMMKTIVLKRVIGNFDDDIAQLYDKYASEEISEADLMKMVAERTGELVDNYEKNIPVLENILSSVNGYFKNAGIDLKKQDDSTRSAVEKGIQGVSQDSISEMNGRLTATTMFLSDILKAVQEQTEATNNVSLAVSDMKAMSVHVNENLRIIKDNIITMIGHLSNIDSNTSKLIDIQKDMSAVRKGIERINDKGVKWG